MKNDLALELTFDELVLIRQAVYTAASTSPTGKFDQLLRDIDFSLQQAKEE